MNSDNFDIKLRTAFEKNGGKFLYSDQMTLFALWLKKENEILNKEKEKNPKSDTLNRKFEQRLNQNKVRDSNLLNLDVTIF
jgi:hypothetical protein